MMTLDTIIKTAIAPAMALLKGVPDSRESRCLLLAIGLQESRFEHRRQMGNGPARGFWEFETGGVRGVVNHATSAGLLRKLCSARNVPCNATEIWRAIEHDDVLAAGLARLLIFTDPYPLPELADPRGAWNLYMRTWRPGRPHPSTWNDFHKVAVSQVVH